MTKENIKDALTLHASNPPFIIRKEIAAALSFSNPQNVDKFLVGLDRIGFNYLIEDVAEAVFKKRERR